MIRWILLLVLACALPLLIWATLSRTGPSSGEISHPTRANPGAGGATRDEELVGAVHVEPARSDLHEAPGETRGAGDASPDWWSRLTAEELARFTHEGRRAVALHLQRDELEHATERGNSDTQVRVAHNLLSISIGTILDQVGLYEESQGNTEVLMSDTRTGFPKAGEKWTRVEIDKRTYRVDHEVFPEFAEVERMLRVLSKPAATVQMEPAILEQVIARCDEALAAIADHPYTKD